MIDYKLQCIGGKPYCFFVCRERTSVSGVKFSSYSLDWERRDYLKDEDSITIPAPKYLKEMLDVAYKIAPDFPFVRIDFYDTDEQLYIGELTFTPYGNLIDYYKDDFLLKTGNLLKLPQKIK
ncbi:MAG: hypothetical protein IJ000_07090 [Paludibacteraceae bacterium]|nr:hypothetical protein [Paludibacteraceae bacterium]